MTDYLADVKKFAQNVNEAAVEGIIKHLGIALRNKDSSLVSCSDQAELDRVKNGFIRKKLAIVADDATIDALLAGICAHMKADKTKERVTFCYLVAEKYGRLGDFVKVPKA